MFPIKFKKFTNSLLYKYTLAGTLTSKWVKLLILPTAFGFYYKKEDEKEKKKCRESRVKDPHAGRIGGRLIDEPGRQNPFFNFPIPLNLILMDQSKVWIKKERGQRDRECLSPTPIMHLSSCHFINLPTLRSSSPRYFMKTQRIHAR